MEMKRPKKSAKLQYKKYEVTQYYAVCPHCKAQCIGIQDGVLMFQCFHCKNPIDLRPKEKRNK